MRIIGRQKEQQRSYSEKCLSFWGRYSLKKKRRGDWDSPQVTIERYLKRLHFMLLCFWAMEELEGPFRELSCLPLQTTAAEEPSRRTKDPLGEPRWMPPAVRAEMAFLAQQLLHATCRSVRSHLRPQAARQRCDLSLLPLELLTSLVGAFLWHNLMPFTCCEMEAEANYKALAGLPAQQPPVFCMMSQMS